MKKIKFDKTKGELKVQINNLDDLWYLHQIVDVGDLVRGKTYRKIKLNSASEKSSVVKKPVTLTIECEKVDFGDDSLRVNGIVKSEIEDIPKGSHHSINIEIDSLITITKKKWLKYLLDKLDKAFSQDNTKILIVSLDREKATFAINKKESYEILLSLDGDVQKKDEKATFKGNFFTEVIKQITEYVERHKVNHVILGSPAFWKDEVYKKISDDKLKKKIILTTCYSHGKNSINEILKNNDTQNLLKEEFVVKETILVNELLEKISKEGACAYGFGEVKKCVELGAIKILLVSDSLIKEKRLDGNFEELETLMNTVDNMKGDVHVINSDNDAGKKLNGLGGVGAILRYKV